MLTDLKLIIQTVGVVLTAQGELKTFGSVRYGAEAAESKLISSNMDSTLLQYESLLVKPGITCYMQTRMKRDVIGYDEGLAWS
ncbi:MAG: hypothetical protein LKE27_09050 [Atopobiaceae bacterium]|nr:hypothetical protein [Atopobiaceae bacterium]